MLAAAHRLRRRGDFAAVVRHGRRAGRGSVVVHVRLAGASDQSVAPAPAVSAPARVGFVVPRAVGPAVVRNKVRRRLRHLVRDRLAALPAGADLVVRALPSAGRQRYEQLGADFDEALMSALGKRNGRYAGSVAEGGRSRGQVVEAR